MPTVRLSLLFLVVLALSAPISAESNRPDSMAPPLVARGAVPDATHGVRLDATAGRLSYSGEFFPTAGGTLELWVRFEPASVGGASSEPVVLFSAATPGEASFVLTQVGDQIVLNARRGSAPYTAAGDFAAELSGPVQVGEADRLHHVAMVWVARGAGRSVARLHLDGAMIASRSDLDLGADWNPRLLSVGCHAAEPAAKRFPGGILRLHLSRLPLANAMLLESAAAAQAGAPWRSTADTMLLIDYREGLAGVFRVRAPLSEERLEAQLALVQGE